ncbi:MULTISPECIES: flagellar hook-associated protein FlgL [Caballeronia]|jgi:flagellar hook-associated protein 3 FlgL|uniref:Flagellar hook protein FlgL n=1 Tax=Caballeronia zhejiangensis TaxID=871203 RepID=A0A656QCH3_9BURK|nr:MULTISPECIES: flagellar hook-associated protein FlgL [Caballeronia]KDR27355.1 flagellar hook protein FlgL [Caballeronia zhejiangensis]MDR5786109.1 flagellar hook-associated protein FlgL [Caballeronia sp. LP003]MDR5794333.1 flagellar hook-associated protein FlgL [Caballeronia sp. LZ008]
MRISSSQYFNLNVASMSDQQSTLSSMYQQISSGKRLLTASDDPLGAAQAVQLTMKSGALTQYGTNQTTALSALQQEDATLSSVSSALTSVQTQIVHAGDGSLTDSDRTAIANTIQGLRDQLFSLANTTDSNGNYIFSGLKGGTQPYTNDPSGVGAQYSGDYGQRTVQISEGRTIPVGDTGASIFGSVLPTESDPVSSAASTNTGTGTISGVSVNDTSNAANASTYTIKFSVSATDGSTTYSVTSNPADSSLPTNVAYTGSTDIALGGQKVTIDGTPADGDTFSVEPAASGNNDIFATLDSLVNALKQPTGSPGAQAALTNTLTTIGTKVSNTFNNVLAAQTVVGGREQQVQSTQSAMQTSQTQTASDIANLTSIDLVSSISQYELTQSSLQAAQMAFSQIQKMSLFDYIQG